MVQKARRGEKRGKNSCADSETSSRVCECARWTSFLPGDLTFRLSSTVLRTRRRRKKTTSDLQKIGNCTFKIEEGEKSEKEREKIA